MKRCFVLLFLLVPFSAVAWNVVESIGFDAQQRFISAQKGFGDNVLDKRYLQGAVYGNVKFNDLLGIELGYQSMDARRREQTLTQDNSVYFGTSLGGFVPDHYLFHSKLSIKGVYGSIVGSLPIFDPYPVSLIASVGLARTQVKISSYVNFVQPTATVTDGRVEFSQNKWVPRLSGGIQYMLGNNFGLRAMAIWEQTARFKLMKGGYSEGQPGTFYASLKNSTTASLGCFYSF